MENNEVEKNETQVEVSGKESKLNLKQCFIDALDIYKNNLVFMLLSVVVAVGLPLLIFFIVGLLNLQRDVIPYIVILAFAPLLDAYAWAMLNAMRKDDKKVVLLDMKKGLDKYLKLIIVRPVVGIATVTALLGFVLPGLYIGTILLYATLFIIDQDEGIISCFVKSWKFVHGNGFWMNLAVFAASTAILLIPYVNILLFALPLLLVVSAYEQQK